MRYSSALLAAIVPVFVSAAPISIGRRAASDNDILVFQFADVLEQLETQFYAAAIAKFNQTASLATDAGFQNPDLVLQQIVAIQGDEATHASVLESQLAAFGKTPLGPSCQFNFDPILTDLSGTLAAARMVENLGVTAYVGAAHILDDPDLLSAAASIATVEARHQTVLNVLSGGGTVIPQAFDLALLPQEVLATAAGLITGGCDLGLTPNAALAVSPAAPQPNATLTFNSTALSGDMSNMFCQIMSGNLQTSGNATVLPANACVVPATLNGPMAVFVTSNDTPLPNDPVARGLVNNTVAGPALMFVDAVTELLPTIVRQLATPVGVAATTTQTVSAAEASAIISGSGTDTAALVASDDTTCSGCGSSTQTLGGVNTYQGVTQAGGVVVVGFTPTESTDGSAAASSSGSSSDSASATDSSSASSTDSSSASSTDSSSASSTDSASASSSTS